MRSREPYPHLAAFEPFHRQSGSGDLSFQDEHGVCVQLKCFGSAPTETLMICGLRALGQFVCALVQELSRRMAYVTACAAGPAERSHRLSRNCRSEEHTSE